MKLKKFISLTVLLAYVFTSSGVHDAFSHTQPVMPQAVNLAASSIFTDIVGFENKDVGRLKMVLQAEMHSLFSKRPEGRTVTFEDVKKILGRRVVKDEDPFHPREMHVFFHEAKKVDGDMEVRCRVHDKQGTRTYTALLDLTANDDNGFPVRSIAKAEDPITMTPEKFLSEAAKLREEINSLWESAGEEMDEPYSEKAQGVLKDITSLTAKALKEGITPDDNVTFFRVWYAKVFFEHDYKGMIKFMAMAKENKDKQITGPMWRGVLNDPSFFGLYLIAGLHDKEVTLLTEKPGVRLVEYMADELFGEDNGRAKLSQICADEYQNNLNNWLVEAPLTLVEFYTENEEYDKAVAVLERLSGFFIQESTCIDDGRAEDKEAVSEFVEMCRALGEMIADAKGEDADEISKAIDAYYLEDSAEDLGKTVAAMIHGLKLDIRDIEKEEGLDDSIDATGEVEKDQGPGSEADKDLLLIQDEIEKDYMNKIESLWGKFTNRAHVTVSTPDIRTLRKLSDVIDKAISLGVDINYHPDAARITAYVNVFVYRYYSYMDQIVNDMANNDKSDKNYLGLEVKEAWMLYFLSKLLSEGSSKELKRLKREEPFFVYYADKIFGKGKGIDALEKMIGDDKGDFGSTLGAMAGSMVRHFWDNKDFVQAKPLIENLHRVQWHTGPREGLAEDIALLMSMHVSLDFLSGVAKTMYYESGMPDWEYYDIHLDATGDADKDQGPGSATLRYAEAKVRAKDYPFGKLTLGRIIEKIRHGFSLSVRMSDIKLDDHVSQRMTYSTYEEKQQIEQKNWGFFHEDFKRKLNQWIEPVLAKVPGEGVSEDLLWLAQVAETTPFLTAVLKLEEVFPRIYEIIHSEEYSKEARDNALLIVKVLAYKRRRKQAIDILKSMGLYDENAYKGSEASVDATGDVDKNMGPRVPSDWDQESLTKRIIEVADGMTNEDGTWAVTELQTEKVQEAADEVLKLYEVKAQTGIPVSPDCHYCFNVARIAKARYGEVIDFYDNLIKEYEKGNYQEAFRTIFSERRYLYLYIYATLAEGSIFKDAYEAKKGFIEYFTTRLSDFRLNQLLMEQVGRRSLMELFKMAESDLFDVADVYESNGDYDNAIEIYLAKSRYFFYELKRTPDDSDLEKALRLIESKIKEIRGKSIDGSKGLGDFVDATGDADKDVGPEGEEEDKAQGTGYKAQEETPGEEPIEDVGSFISGAAREAYDDEKPEFRKKFNAIVSGGLDRTESYEYEPLDLEEMEMLFKAQRVKMRAAMRESLGDYIETLNEIAPEVGISLSRPILEKPYTLFVAVDVFKDNGEYKEEKVRYADRFNLERINTDRPGEIVDRIIGKVRDKQLDPNNVIVQLPEEFSLDINRWYLENLVSEVPGIKFIIMDTRGLKDEEASAEYRRNLFSIMLLARKISKDTPAESHLYVMFSFFLKSMCEEADVLAVEEYFNALKGGDINVIIKTVLSYRPIEAFDMPEYENVSATLISA